MPSPVSECLYCQNNDTLHQLMIKIEDLKVSQLFLFKEQSFTGRCNVVYNDHGVEFYELSDEQRNLFMEDVATAAKALAKAFNPTKINYGAYADTLSHLHFHIVPKYKDGYGFGGVFEMNPQKTYLSDTEYEAVIEKIKANL
ncbi:HIT family protein [Flavobacterium reichenbachii]|uniref:Histidine triad (HIT) protein n=1 Tax=Flavobacterium reichenbachii TaxID=362418 RepID=A0A085ZNX1_9FLAO|nr:HIT domain-containing protein [Flavobacterium reichenbachii]KFF06135.1 histidine triad (HIT) protein [Flavobacterium reichenbachii]OXB17641.1 HIT family protein [Flavobacterium reichenbachii]